MRMETDIHVHDVTKIEIERAHPIEQLVRIRLTDANGETQTVLRLWGDRLDRPEILIVDEHAPAPALDHELVDEEPDV